MNGKTVLKKPFNYKDSVVFIQFIRSKRRNAVPGSRIKTTNQTITEQLGRANGLVMVVCRTHSRRMAVHYGIIGASTKLGCPLYFTSLCFFVSFYQIRKNE